MIKIGEFNKLRATRQTENGVYLTDKDENGGSAAPQQIHAGGTVRG